MSDNRKDEERQTAINRRVKRGERWRRRGKVTVWGKKKGHKKVRKVGKRGKMISMWPGDSCRENITNSSFHHPDHINRFIIYRKTMVLINSKSQLRITIVLPRDYYF